MVTSREIRLKSRPVGMPSAENFELAAVTVPDPAPGQVQVKNIWMTVDPYMRGRMVDRASRRAGRISRTIPTTTSRQSTMAILCACQTARPVTPGPSSAPDSSRRGKIATHHDRCKQSFSYFHPCPHRLTPCDSRAVFSRGNALLA
jgi:N-terminal domain of oxidoreductase